MHFVENLNHSQNLCNICTLSFSPFFGGRGGGGGHTGIANSICATAAAGDMICLLAGKTLIQVGCPYNCLVAFNSTLVITMGNLKSS